MALGGAERVDGNRAHGVIQMDDPVIAAAAPGTPARAARRRNKGPRRHFSSGGGEGRQEPSLRVVFSLCVLCLALAIYSGYRILAETHLHTEPSPIPGALQAHRDSIDAVEQAQRIRASRLETTRAR